MTASTARNDRLAVQRVIGVRSALPRLWIAMDQLMVSRLATASVDISMFHSDRVVIRWAEALGLSQHQSALTPTIPNERRVDL